MKALLLTLMLVSAPPDVYQRPPKVLELNWNSPSAEHCLTTDDYIRLMATISQFGYLLDACEGRVCIFQFPPPQIDPYSLPSEESESEEESE